MEIIPIKYGNLMGSPDMKAALFAAGTSTPEADRAWDDLAAIKIRMGQNGASTSLLIKESGHPMFPAAVDLSFICADPEMRGGKSVDAALAALESHGVAPGELKSLFVTHPHADHFDPRLTALFPNARVFALPDSSIPGTEPLDMASLPAWMSCLNTPGHGTPHCSYIFDAPQWNLAIAAAGDLVMSHAHYLSMDKPLAFADPETGRASVSALLDALSARNLKYRMIIPGHDMPFFV
jgi:glyoxylase-like metal-dependent hydrolase (beta-lactamase superfamily II)